MAKLRFVFICVFLLVQWSSAARIARDAPETPTKTEAANEPINFNQALATLTEGIQKALSKDNLDKIMANLGEAGDKLKEFGQNVLDRAQSTASDLANAASKKDEKSP